MTQPTDNELVAGALSGSADAYRELVRRYQRPISSLVQRMLGDPVEAEDVAQEVFVKAFRNLGRFEPGRKLSSWLFKIAHNATIDRMRRQRPDTVPLEAVSADGEETWEVLQAPDEQSPERRAQRAEVAEAIGAALGRLRPQYREVLLLRFQQGLAYREIAEILELRIGTVKIHLHRARKLLAAELAAAGFEAPQRFAGEEADDGGDERRVTTGKRYP
jgi:RNA polymerase sigma-70 factor (ECF subfamily)